jgi:YVTN family beta-propeller protein
MKLAHATLRTASLLALAALLASCGGGKDEARQQAAAAPEGRMGTLAASTSLAVALPQEPDPMMSGLNIPADAATRGMWGPVQPWPMNAIHAALLPSGKVLSYGAPQGSDSQDGRTFSVWTPSLGFGSGAHAVSFEPGRFNSFCSAATWLADSQLLLSGGNSPRASQVYNALTQVSSNIGPQLADDRWYATMLTLPDGRAVMLGGIDPYTEGMYQNPEAAIANGQVSMTPELYTPGTGWRSLGGARNRLAFGPDYLRASYPRAWVAPNGEVFGISADQMWWLDVWGNGGTGAIRSAGVFKGPPSATAPVNVGATNTAVMFAPGRILQLGGNGGFNGDGLPASNMATVVDINSGNAVVAETARMANARRFPSATVLADGRVLVTGGTRRGNNGGGDAVYAAELWNPATGTWTTLASAAVIRVYHSNALLMPNGTVLSLGGGTPGPVFNQNAEVFYPPYLFQAQGGGSVLAPRPVMTGLNSRNHKPGQTVQIEMLDASPMARVVLAKAGINTHSFNSGQRFVPLAFTQSGDRISAVLPGNANELPPGAWQLFVINPAGTPSRAALLRIDAGDAALPRNVPLALASNSSSDTAMGIGAGDLGNLLALPGTPSNDQWSSTRFIVRAGLADANCVSLEFAARPGQWLRHQGFRLRLSPNDNSDLFRNDATFCPEPGLAGHSVSLRSRNFPTYLLRSRNGELWIDPEAADAQFRSSATWSVRLAPEGPSAAPLPSFAPLNVSPVVAGAGSVSYNPGAATPGISYSWSFGDGSPATPFAASPAISKTWAAPGVYTVTLTARNAANQTSSTSFVQAVHTTATASAPRHASALLVEPRSNASARLWVANPDTNTVAVVDTVTRTRVAEIAVGSAPRSLARAPNGQVWVVNRDSASISVIDPGSLAVVRTLALPRASQPQALVFAPDGSAAWVTLEAVARLLRLDPATGAQTGAWATPGAPRGLALSGDGRRLLVSRFISAPLPGEGTANVSTSGNVGGEVWAFDTASMATPSTVWLRHSDKADTPIQGSGIPNYLGAPVISPDGRSAWVPSKQDNIRRGILRNGLNLDFQNSVRAISSRIDLSAASPSETLALRVDHDNASLASGAVFDASGSFLFVALETSRQVAVVDAARGLELARLEVQLAPQALALAPDGLSLYVQNFMSRSVSVIDLQPLLRNGSLALAPAQNVATVASETLPAVVLRGKQLFYDARDPRLSRDSYMSCASCHSDAGHDGRTWDFTGFGEGLRNTPALRGRAGMGQGFVHWTANFDEIQDFEGQIRAFAGGSGLMSDTQFNAGTRSAPLGDRKAGLSADLDALAAYVGSLSAFDANPWRNADGSLSAAAVAGRTVFANANCASCHAGTAFSNSAGAAGLRDIGTLRPSSGRRLGAPLTGLDVPTLRDVWSTAPYLHDGSAPTLAAAVQAHSGNTVAGTDLANLVAYLQLLGAEEPAPPGPAAPTPGMGSGLRGNYFGNPTLGGTPLLSRVEAPWFNWGTGAPGPGVAADNFSVRWSGELQALEAGSYQFRTNSDDGVRVWVNGVLIIDNWTVHAPTIDTSGPVVLTAGQRVPIVIEYQEFGGGAVLELGWLRPGGSWAQVPAAQLYAAPGAPANVPPTVALTAPASATSVIAGATLNLAASAADTDGSISRVEFYANGSLLGTDTTAPYGLAWTAGTAGSYTLTARAFDNTGASTASAGVLLTVTAAPGLPNAVYRLVAVHSGKVLDISGVSTANGARAIQWPWTGGNNQRWRLAGVGNGEYTLTAVHSGKLLEVAACSLADGGAVQQNVPSSTPACQRWRIEPQPDGSYRLVNVRSGKVLDVSGISTANGAPVHQWGWLNGANQRWRLERL